MAQSVFSASFGKRAGFSGGAALIYTVPAGMRALVKCLTITWGDVTISGLDAWFEDAGSVKFWRKTLLPLGTTDEHSGGTALFFGSVVLEAGEDLLIQAVAGTADFSAAGYLLQLP